MFSFLTSLSEAASANGGSGFIDCDVSGAGIAAAPPSSTRGEERTTLDAEGEPQPGVAVPDWTVFKSYISNVKGSLEHLPGKFNEVAEQLQEVAGNFGVSAMEVGKDLTADIMTLSTYAIQRAAAAKSDDDITAEPKEVVPHVLPWDIEVVRVKYEQVLREFSDMVSEEELSNIIKELYIEVSAVTQILPQMDDLSSDSKELSNERKHFASTIIDLDTNLKSLRFSLVPKHVSEKEFWNQYFQRIEYFENHELMSRIVKRLQSETPHQCTSNDDINIEPVLSVNDTDVVAGDDDDDDELARYERELLAS